MFCVLALVLAAVLLGAGALGALLGCFAVAGGLRRRHPPVRGDAAPAPRSGAPVLGGAAPAPKGGAPVPGNPEKAFRGRLTAFSRPLKKVGGALTDITEASANRAVGDIGFPKYQEDIVGNACQNMLRQYFAMSKSVQVNPVDLNNIGGDISGIFDTIRTQVYGIDIWGKAKFPDGSSFDKTKEWNLALARIQNTVTTNIWGAKRRELSNMEKALEALAMTVEASEQDYQDNFANHENIANLHAILLQERDDLGKAADEKAAAIEEMYKDIEDKDEKYNALALGIEALGKIIAADEVSLAEKKARVADIAKQLPGAALDVENATLGKEVVLLQNTIDANMGQLTKDTDCHGQLEADIKGIEAVITAAEAAHNAIANALQASIDKVTKSTLDLAKDKGRMELAKAVVDEENAEIEEGKIEVHRLKQEMAAIELFKNSVTYCRKLEPWQNLPKEFPEVPQNIVKWTAEDFYRAGSEAGSNRLVRACGHLLAGIGKYKSFCIDRFIYDESTNIELGKLYGSLTTLADLFTTNGVVTVPQALQFTAIRDAARANLKGVSLSLGVWGSNVTNLWQGADDIVKDLDEVDKELDVLQQPWPEFPALNPVCDEAMEKANFSNATRLGGWVKSFILAAFKSSKGPPPWLGLRYQYQALWQGSELWKRAGGGIWVEYLGLEQHAIEIIGACLNFAKGVAGEHAELRRVAAENWNRKVRDFLAKARTPGELLDPCPARKDGKTINVPASEYLANLEAAVARVRKSLSEMPALEMQQGHTQPVAQRALTLSERLLSYPTTAKDPSFGLLFTSEAKRLTKAHPEKGIGYPENGGHAPAKDGQGGPLGDARDIPPKHEQGSLGDRKGSPTEDRQGSPTGEEWESHAEDRQDSPTGEGWQSYSEDRWGRPTGDTRKSPPEEKWQSYSEDRWNGSTEDTWEALMKEEPLAEGKPAKEKAAKEKAAAPAGGRKDVVVQAASLADLERKIEHLPEMGEGLYYGLVVDRPGDMVALYKAVAICLKMRPPPSVEKRVGKRLKGATAWLYEIVRYEGGGHYMRIREYIDPSLYAVGEG